MIYRFKIRCKKEKESFLRVVDIEENSTFLDFHNYLQQCSNYDNSQMTSFFLSDEEWSRLDEIALMDMGVETNGMFIMNKTPLNQLIKSEGDRLMYVFDFFSERYFKIELTEILEKNKNAEYPLLIEKIGNPPKQIIVDSNLEGHENLDVEGFEQYNLDEEEGSDDGIKFESLDDFDNI